MTSISLSLRCQGGGTSGWLLFRSNYHQLILGDAGLADRIEDEEQTLGMSNPTHQAGVGECVKFLRLSVMAI
jgi:hypothetical protein